MAGKAQRNWTREQLTKALALYLQIPFGQMHSRNPLLIALAKRIGRTSSAVALKLVNFASLDPAHRRRGVKGMSHASVSDRRIWDEYYGKWDRLVNDVAGDLTEEGQAFEDSRLPLTLPVGPTERIASIKVRAGQYFFRNSVLAAYDNRCCITGIQCRELLRASHIIPWSESKENRLNPENGLCLNALHDAAFDRGLMTIDQDCRVVFSSHLRTGVPKQVYAEVFACYANKSIRLPERFLPARDSLLYHATHIFRK